MTKPNVYILDAATGEETIRPMDDVEFAKYEADQKEQIEKEKLTAEKVEKKSAALDKLQKLGLTIDDLEALGL